MLGLYFLPYFTSLGPIGEALIVSDIGALLAGVSLVISVLLYFWTPRKFLLFSAFGLYCLLAAMCALLILSTGGMQSTFVSLWIVISVFASVFGAWGISAMLIAVAGFAVLVTLENASVVPVANLIVIGIGGITPLIASYIIFHSSKDKSTTHDDQTYHELTTELTQATNKSATVISAISEGVIALDAKGVIELINPAAEHIIGWGGDDAVGLDYKSVLKLTDNADRPLTNANDPVVNVLTNNQELLTKDFYTTTTSGKRLILSIVVSPIGQLGQGVIIVFRDITREQAEEREQAEFISTASHEMRTPVASIEGYLGLALNPSTSQIDDKARDFITKAQESVQHLGRLFQDLLDVSKAEDGRLSNHPGIVDTVAFVGTIVEGLTPKAQEKGLRLFYKPDPNSDNDQRTIAPVFYTNVDNDHLREVTQNLIENAIKYTPEGDVIVDVTGDDDHVTISIKDSGIGIPKEDIPHLFQKFYRVDNTATREIGGTGLGLYLCRRLAEVMGGRIWLESEFQKGSTFYLELPRTEREEAMRIMEVAAESIQPAVSQASTSPVEPPAPVSPDTPQPVGQTPARNPIYQTQPQSAAPQVPVPISAASPNPTAPTIQNTVPQAPAQPVAAPTLDVIEQNPAAYQQQRKSVSIPVRNNNQQ